MIELDSPNKVYEGYSSCDSMEDMSVSPAELRHDTSSTQTLSNSSGVTPLEDVENILPPSLVLYAIPSENQPSKQFIHELQALLSHYKGIVVQFADASDPGTSLQWSVPATTDPCSPVVYSLIFLVTETRHQLHERFCNESDDDDDASGSARTSQSTLTFPALVLDDCVWIPADEPDWHEIVHEYLQEHCFVYKEDTLSDDTESIEYFEEEEIEEIDNASVDCLEEDDVEELISYLDLDGADREDDSSVSSCNAPAGMGLHQDTVVTEYSGDSSVTQWTANRGQSLRAILTDSPSSNYQEKDLFPPEPMILATNLPKAPLSFEPTYTFLQKPMTSEPGSPVPKASIASNAPTSPIVRIVGPAKWCRQRFITLPGGSKVTVADLTRQLMHDIPHRIHRVPAKSNSSPPVLQNLFRGSEGMMALKRLFGNAGTVKVCDNDDVKWMELGLKLLSHGILHDYTPSEKDFREKFLAIQPLRNMYSLNTLLHWSSNAPVDADQSCASDAESMTVVLLLSRSMDAIFDRPRQSEAARHLFQEFEEAVCELQTITVPNDPKFKQAFALNLANLMVRHAMILVSSNQRKGWAWPASLEELDRFFMKVGYNVDGVFMSVSDVRSLLFNGNDTPTDINPTSRLSTSHTNAQMTSCLTWRGRSRRDTKSFCIVGGSRWKKEVQCDVDEIYPNALIATDVRFLMALTWGTNISPIAHTVHPEQLDNAMQIMAEQYCQKHITITEGPTAGTTKVVLPPLLSWYRLDFGKYAENVLQSIDGYLSKPQQIQIHHAQQFGKLKIAFGNTTPSDWQVTFPKVTSLATLTPSTPRRIPNIPVSPRDTKEQLTTESNHQPKRKLVLATEHHKAVNQINFDQQEAAPPVVTARHGTTVPASGPFMVRDTGPFESMTDLSLYTSEMQLPMNSANQKVFPDFKSASPPTFPIKTPVHPAASATQDMKENDLSSRKFLTKLHLQPSTMKNVFTEIEVNGLADAQRGIVPVLSPPPEYTQWSASPEETSPVTKQEIETGCFPLKLTRVYPTMDNDFCYSQSTESGGGRGEENVCLLHHRWKDLIQPALGPRQASLGDSLLLPPGTRSSPPVPTTAAINHHPMEYTIHPPPGLTNLCHNVTEASIELGDLERGQSWYFRSDVSAITFGSEFEALLRMNSLPQLVPSPGGGTTMTYSPDPIHRRFQHPSIGGGYQ
jgi:Protein of unknown function, DUF547